MQQQQQTAVVVSITSARVNKKHLQIKANDLSSKELAAEIGEELMDIKQRLKHGEFKPWVEANCDFSYRKAREYMQVSRSKMADLCTFDACTSIREVLDLGKKPKEPKPKLEPDEADLQTMARLKTLADRGATEGERQAAQEKLQNFASSFGYDEEEAKEKAKEQQAQEADDEAFGQELQAIKRKIKTKGEDWIAEQLIWAMAQDQEIFMTIAKRMQA